MAELNALLDKNSSAFKLLREAYYRGFGDAYISYLEGCESGMERREKGFAEYIQYLSAQIESIEKHIKTGPFSRLSIICNLPKNNN